ncbi:MAG: hypothetical protein ICV78_18420 [Tolypothrix sp. Co-bin9]|nr:hypothetical protein [Tolypothrix sp. Co-bin9]
MSNYLPGMHSTKVEPPIKFAAQINALDRIESLVQRLSKTNPKQRIGLLESFAIVHLNPIKGGSPRNL